MGGQEAPDRWSPRSGVMRAMWVISTIKQEWVVFTAGPIDPRDISWEQDVAVYRVYFEDRTGATDEWRITGAANVSEVLTWQSSKRLAGWPPSTSRWMWSMTIEG